LTELVFFEFQNVLQNLLITSMLDLSIDLIYFFIDSITAAQVTKVTE